MKALVFVAFFLFPLNLWAQDFHAKIRAAAESRDYQTLIAELETLKKSDKKIFTANNYDYLLARAAENRGDAATAIANFQAVAARGSVLRPYALWHLAALARSSGNLMLERIYLNELLTTAPGSLMTKAADARMARSFYESRDYDSAVKAILAASNGASATNSEQQTNLDEIARENLVLLGQSYLQSGKTAEARQIFDKIIASLPNPAQPDDFALEAVRGLDALDSAPENFGKIAPQLADLEHFRRARIYQFNRDFADARLHFQAIVERYPNSPNLPESLYQIGRGYAQENNFQEAVKWFERVIAEFPEDGFARDALSQSAAAYARMNKPREAVTRYQRFIEKYKDEPGVERAYLNLIDVLRDTGEETEALNRIRQTREKFKGKTPEALALFAQVRIRFAQNDWTNALADLSELEKLSDLGGMRVAGGTNRTEIAFLKAYALEQSGKFSEAIDAYLSIPDGRGEYYGWRATERLRALRNDEKTRRYVEAKINSLNVTSSAEENRKNYQSLYRLTDDANNLKQILERLKECYVQLTDYKETPGGKMLEFGRREVLREERTIKSTESPHQAIADELLFLGLYDEAAPELETALREKLAPTTAEKLKSLVGIKTAGNNLADFPPDTAYTLAVFYKRGDMADRTVAYIEPLWRNVPFDYQLELIPREQLELLYPTPYTDSLLRYAPERSLDPRFLLSIMRQESRFRADVKSFAAARGLMQFISSTADRIAAELNRKNFRQDELYDPPTAVLFGAQYLGGLFQMFPDQPQAVAASYNGGEHNMTRWYARAKSAEADRYVPEILFSQSKDYVYKVMANYRVYRFVYDEQLKTKTNNNG